jgi:ketosteroid isomerase-like protein
MADFEKLTREFIELQNRDDLDGAMACFAPDGKRVAPNSVRSGQGELRQFYAAAWRALGKHHITVDRMFRCPDDTVAIEYTEDAQFMEEARTPYGTIGPATRRPFTIHGAAFLKFRGEKIAELRAYSDAWLQMLVRSGLDRSTATATV